jgi:hypothetical protein
MRMANGQDRNFGGIAGPTEQGSIIAAGQHT